MAKVLQIFKGGFEHNSKDRDGKLRDSRIAVNQRPADGHTKSASWEDHIRVNKHRFKCQGLTLEVGDVIGIHTTPTFGIIEAMGLSVITAEQGLKFKVVSSDPSVSLDALDFTSYSYDEGQKKFSQVAANLTVGTMDDIGDSVKYYAGYHKPGGDLIRITNPIQIGLEVVALPAGGLMKEFDIESRLHFRQSVRPPACLECC